jgi:EAL domain-containing protein (putative c-di-GMP-specific phosphodiesterase class I)
LPRVLVVDDELVIARALSRTLVAAGYHVSTASDGETAQELLSRESFDVIVSDVWMPGIDGIGVLRAARERDLDVAVILMTGSPRAEDAARAVASGALMYLVKPIEPRALVQVVQNGVRMTRIARLRRAATVGKLEKQVGDRAGLEVGFARALDTLWLAYQPIVGWPGRTVFGYEALLRSRESMLPSPAAVLDAAERLGQLAALGRAIRARAAAAVVSSTELGAASMFVNLHPDDLLDDDLFAASAPLTKVASRVVLEITERAPLDGMTDVTDRIDALRKLGFRVALDDFGEGYAGLTAFARLHPDIVKLDMAIVRDVHKDPMRRSLIAAVVSMCVDMNVTVIAEGVEIAEERETLATLGCPLFQGYLFAKPGERFPAPSW